MTMQYFFSDLKKMYKNWLVLIAIMLIFGISIADPILMRRSYEYSPNPYNWWLFMNTGRGCIVYNTLFWFIPSLFTGLLAFSERTTSIYGILLTKEKRSTYYRNKSIVAFIIPFITCLAFFSLNLGLVYMTCPTVDPIEDYLVPTIGSFAYPLFMESPVKMAMAYILLHTLSIAILTVLYLNIQLAFKIKNKYIALILPALIMYVANFALQILGYYKFSLTYLIQPVAASASTEILDSGSLMLVLCANIVAAILCYTIGKVRNRDVV